MFNNLLTQDLFFATCNRNSFWLVHLAYQLWEVYAIGFVLYINFTSNLLKFTVLYPPPPPPRIRATGIIYNSLLKLPVVSESVSQFDPSFDAPVPFFDAPFPLSDAPVPQSAAHIRKKGLAESSTDPGGGGGEINKNWSV